MKKFCQLDRREIRIRLALLLVLAVVVGLWTGRIIYPALYILYVLLNVALAFGMARAPDRSERGPFLIYIFLVSLPLTVVTVVTLVMWAEDLPLMKVMAIMLVSANLLNMLTVRAVSPMLLGWDTLWVSAGLVGFNVIEVVQHGFGPRVIVFTVCCAALMLYYISCAFAIIRFRHVLDRARAVESERSMSEAIGRLTGGMAHDFNNLLTVILGNIELSRLTRDPTERESLLADADQAGQRAARLTSQLVSFARKDILSPRETDISAVVEDVRGVLMRLLPGTILIDVSDTLNGLPKAYLDPDKLESVLINLAVNARDAMPLGGLLTFAGRETAVAGKGEAPKPGRYVMLSVSDDGEGIAEDILSQVTEPFVTTKTVGDGSGLGLSMARGFAEQSGGWLEIDSSQGGGTSVRLYFPIAK